MAAEINQTLARAASPSPVPGRAFVLYLRPFGVTGLLNIGGLDFESSMAYNLSPMMPMIALGHPGEAIGAGRILTTDEHWRDEILRLVDKAERIMLIPSHREGTKWEIAKLKDNQHFGKTIFAMPPEMSFGDGHYSDEWNRAAAALVVLEVPAVFNISKAVAAMAVTRRMPTMLWGGQGDAGGLVSYGTDFVSTYPSVAAFVDKVLKGAKPADTPFEVVSRRELAVNLKTARELGLTVAADLLKRADRVIE
jgi:hypothetical protein